MSGWLTTTFGRDDRPQREMVLAPLSHVSASGVSAPGTNGMTAACVVIGARPAGTDGPDNGSVGFLLETAEDLDAFVGSLLELRRDIWGPR